MTRRRSPARASRPAAKEMGIGPMSSRSSRTRHSMVLEMLPMSMSKAKFGKLPKADSA
jgi:hypothetical protein